ncbi:MULTISPECIES: hypothetical protein [Micrococcales]|uniref:KfrA N-terminal DNA-binding domain-containing protein n=1 Tax=Glutamicibacter arilaitensis TaxID=256701 RepID=A0A2N7S1B4_9MICC|nr:MULTISPECIES: hypothetical protein [Micrococcales]MDA3145848.1 hypothetical protein [Leucobacter sp. UCMA 4100]MDA3146901.1 hypothetical protein [Leucobacter sp. UCMA 4100]PCC34033.1 hypothetical protein CIK74_11260 [Glutamicibacter sp. BW77]PMQ18552.1 hypothetical protein CIK84_18495 [Glutamicibacter arilaitensis]PMQ19936.1 hypothetical protein CIK84_15045 [Glutamicibacter arilaitensis]
MTDETQRQAIRDAMTRLVEGKPLRSDGKLTIKSLANEAGVKRWLLTHKFTDLQDEFKVRMELTGGEPAVVVKLREQLKERDETITRLRAEIRELTNDRQQLERVINVLSLEQQHGRTDKSKVVGIRRPKDGS